MRKSMPIRRFTTAVLISVLGLVATGCGSSDGDTASSTTARTVTATAVPREAPVEEDMVDVGGHTLHLVCQGTAKPVVLVETGFGQSSSNWLPMLDLLSEDHRAC